VVVVVVDAFPLEPVVVLVRVDELFVRMPVCGRGPILDIWM
jgi:hypothetical protein